MNRATLFFLTGLVLTLPRLPARGALPPAAGEQDFERDIRPLLDSHCGSCHGPRRKKARVDLSSARTEADLTLHPAQWLDALNQLKNHSMPPEDARKQPSDAERDTLVAWLGKALDRIDERAPRDPGRVTLRRLNRVEYNNTIHDLVGLDLHPADDFPPDDVSEGFDTLGDVLTLPPLLLERYLDAGDQILDHAIVPEGPVQVLEQSFAGATLRLDQELSSRVSVRDAGRYEVRLRASQEHGVEGVALAGIQIDGVDLAILRVQAGPDRPDLYTCSIPLLPGERKLTLRHSPHRAPAKDEKSPDTRLLLERYEIIGPERSRSHHRIFFVHAKDRGAAKKILDRFATRAFRRPLAAGESDRLLALFDAAQSRGNTFARAVRSGLWSILVSPQFLFRVERDSSDLDEAGACRLNDWELATRLSYFLWSTMPDEILVALAAEGRLRDPAVLKAQTRRMLADPRARALVDNFAGQWLGLRKLQTIQPDRSLFPSFNETLRRAMIDEAWLFFERILRENRSLLDLLSATDTFLNEPLAKHYGIKGVSGAGMRPVDLKDPNRGGILTMAGMLTLTSHPTRTSAVKRGKWILDEILGAPPPPPPPNVPDLDEASKNRPDAETLTLRRRLELHRADPQCFGCHQRMDVLGLGLENFDPIGRWRDTEAGQRLDASGVLPTGERFSTPAELKKILAGYAEEFAETVTEKMLVFALGRATERCDRREIRRIVGVLKKHDYRISTLIEELVGTYPFRHRRPLAGKDSR